MFWKILSKEKGIDQIFHNNINYEQRRLQVLCNILISGVWNNSSQCSIDFSLCFGSELERV